MKNISVSKQFQRSIRIDQDTDKLEALNGYVSIQSSIDTLKRMAQAIFLQRDFAFTWTGAYGCGKSSLALVLASLISKDENIRLKAKDILHITEGSEDYLNQVFCTQIDSWQRICLVGGRKSLRFDLFNTLNFMLNKTTVKKANEIESAEIFDLLKEILATHKVLLLIDELGKYLEYAIQDNDIFFLQELAEFAARENGNFIVIGILHQSFEAYVGSLTESIRNEWAKVQGRFQNYLLEPSPFESINLIAHSIEKNNYDISIHQDLNERLASYLTRYTKNFKDSILNTLNLCLPLHGVSAILLASIARKSYGQNERSIYSFLNSLELFSFNEFINDSSNENALYRPCELFDYLRVNQDININLSKDSHKWAIAKDLVERIEVQYNDTTVELIKTIAAIEIFGSIFRLNATHELLLLCLNCNNEDFEEALQNLQKEHCLIYRHTDSAYHLFVGSDFDFEVEINKVLSKTDFDLKILNELLTSNTRIIARRHNLKTGTMRFMQISLIQGESFEQKLSNLKTSNDLIGEFILCICSDKDLTNRIKELASQHSNLIVGFVANSEELIAKTREYSALLELQNNPSLEGDDIARKEVALRLFDSQQQLRLDVLQMIQHATWILPNGTITKLNEREMSSLASDLADKIFYNTVHINNELINRNKISPNITASRRSLMLRLINQEQCSKQDLDYDSTPADFCIYDSLIQNTGIHKLADDGKYHLSIETINEDRNDLKVFFQETIKYIDSQETITLDQLYEFWQKPPFGMKLGVMPIYALILILSLPDRFAYYDQQYFITDFDEKELEELLYYSAKFKIRSYKTKPDYNNILNKIAKAISKVQEPISSIQPLFLARKLVRFAYTLPDVTKKSSKPSSKAKTLRSTLLEADDPIKLLFDQIPKICPNITSNEDELAQLLLELKDFYNNQLNTLLERFFTSFDERSQSLESLIPRAQAAAKNTSNPKINALAKLLVDYHSNNYLFIKRFITLCSETNEEFWSDAIFDSVLYELPKLSIEFRQAESLANISGSTKARRLVSLTFAASAKNDEVLLADISPDDENFINKKVQEIAKDLDSLDSNLKIAILAELGMLIAKSSKQ